MLALAMGYLFAKALHIVGFVSWFAGLFYIVRLFIYHVEAAARPEPERSLLQAQFTLMERRLWLAITVPAMVITVVFGGWLGYTYLSAVPLATGAWLLVKLGLVALLLAYHLLCGRIRKQLAAGTCKWTSPQLRMWNELATLLLVAIVMLAVFKTLFSAVWGTLALVGFGLALGAAVRLLRKRAAG
jgi:protoporphyrinogen IX oxidase